MLCVRVYVCTSVREQMGDEVKGERTTSRVPKASTFCYAIARSWRRDSIKRRTRHHGRPINPQTQKWIMTFPAAIVHAFYYARNYVRDSWVDSRSSGRLLSAATYRRSFLPLYVVLLARKPYRLLVYIDFFPKRLYLLARGSKPIHHRGPKFVRSRNSGLHYIHLSFVAGIAETRLNLHSIPVSNHQCAELGRAEPSEEKNSDERGTGSSLGCSTSSGTFYQVILELRKVYRIAEMRVLILGCFIPWNLRFL
ncbi:hypothetical protein ALC60_10933 [Trachymyrmex zeteki]|uniref:Uncharacterized protein n=1 Tax=Mycetomoellerius zeteki TaxID=64791 RepID=A0A151WQ55_9HYME|nr:hypothetical protein ALC60_10933 [Trachymyrmex zeteki]